MIRSGQMVMLCALALLTIGVVMVNSAGMAVRPLDAAAGLTPDPGVTAASILTSRATIYAALAIGAMLLASRLPVRRMACRLERVVWFQPAGDVGLLLLGAGGLIVLLSMVYWPGIAREVNGSARWISLGVPGLGSIQPSELAKWGLVGLIAWYGARLASYPENRLRGFFSGLVPGLLAVGAVSVVVVAEDLGTGFLMVVVAAVLLVAAGARLWHFAAFVPPAAALLVAAIVTSPYRMQRIVSFLDPYADPLGASYQGIQSMATVAGGGLFGRGLGHGLQKFGYLPEDTTDFLFAVICEELGLAGAALVMFLYGVLIWTGLGIVRRESSMLLKLLGLGVISTIAIQTLINLIVVTGLGPTKGIALPLLSAGGTGWILTAAVLGVVAAINRTQPEPAIATECELVDDPAPIVIIPKARIRVYPAGQPS